jgi:hypothetical protein
MTAFAFISDNAGNAIELIEHKTAHCIALALPKK